MATSEHGPSGRRMSLRAAGRGFVLLASAPLAALAAAAPDAASIKIGTIGAGHIGGTLGSLWARAGHSVMFSSRHPEELKSLVDGLDGRARAGTIAEAIAFADAVLLAVPYRALPEIGKEHAAALAAKALVLDACNPIPGRDGEIAAWAREKGAGAATAELLPGAKLVRAFNAIGAGRLSQIHAQAERVAMPMAGNDAAALDLASKLVREIGLEPVVIGSLAMGRFLIPGTPLAGEHTPDQIRQITATLR